MRRRRLKSASVRPLNFTVRRLIGMFDSSVIRRSGNGPKVLLTFCAVLGGGLLAYIGSFMLTKSSAAVQFKVALLGILLGALGLAIAWVEVRCPSCRKRWIWDAMRQGSVNGWLIGLLATRSCPGCGYPDNQAVGSPPNNRWRGP
jgi:hypothetical protein